MAFAAKNLVTKAFVMKFVELVFVFIVFLMFRVGDSGNMFHWGKYVVLRELRIFRKQIFSGTGFLTITDSPPTPSTPSTVSPPTTTSASSRQFDQHVDVHSSSGREGVDLFIAGLPVYDERPENDLVFGVLTSVGYFFITIVLMIGVIMGDDQKYTMFLFNFFGFLFFIAMGSEQIDAYKHAPYGVAKARAMGSMAILTSFVFLVDTVFNIMAMWNGQ